MTAVDYFSREAAAFRDSYQQSPDFRARYAIWTKLIDRYAAGARTCLDIGCGPGLFSLHAAERGLETVGIDPSPRMLELGLAESQRRGLTNVSFIEAALPLPGDLLVPPADLILCSSVLEYVGDLEAALASIIAHLNPGGHFLVSLPNGQSLYRRYEKVKYRLTGKPDYYEHVRHVLPIGAALHQFSRFGLCCQEARFYGAEPLLSRLAAPLLPARFSQNLYVLALAKER